MAKNAQVIKSQRSPQTLGAMNATSQASAEDLPRLLNRELGILAFNERVFALAEDETVPLLERLRYVTIVSNNVDELFEVRVAELYELLEADRTDHATIRENLRRIAGRAGRLAERQYRLLNAVLLPAMAEQGIVLLQRSQLIDAQRRWVADYFETEVEPLLTPIALDPAHPFPRLLNKSLTFVVELEGRDSFGRPAGLAVLQAPRALPRVLRLPEAISEGRVCLMTLAQVILACVADLFPGLEVRSVNQFRVTRNSELFVDDEEITDLRAALQGELPQRHYGDAVRLEVSSGCPETIVSRLLREFDLSEDDCYRVDGPVNLNRL